MTRRIRESQKDRSEKKKVRRSETSKCDNGTNAFSFCALSRKLYATLRKKNGLLHCNIVVIRPSASNDGCAWTYILLSVPAKRLRFMFLILASGKERVHVKLDGME